MKKIILVMWILVGINLYGVDKAECEKLFRSAIANFYLENTCKYDKHISAAVRQVFENKNCTKIFNDDAMKRLNSEVLGESYKRMNKIGRDDSCKSHKVKYDELEKVYLQSTH